MIMALYNMPIIEGKGIFLLENFHFELLLNFLRIVKFSYILFDKGEFWGNFQKAGIATNQCLFSLRILIPTDL